MKKLNVFYEGWGERFHLGTLADAGGDIFFEYATDAINRRLELSPLRLPLAKKVYQGFPDYLYGLPGVINDSLPDGWGMLLMDRLFRRRRIPPDAVSVLDRLALVGCHGMGALTYHPASDDEPVVGDVDLYELSAEIKSIQRVPDEEPESVLRELLLVGGSPQGARPKALINVDFFNTEASRVHHADNENGVPWLFKFPTGNDHPEVCAIEAVYAHLARETGLNIPETRYVDLGAEGAAFGIVRFDRKGTVRIPTHTVAGMTHLNFRMPQVDYLRLLRVIESVTHDIREVQKAFLQCVFNVVMNNRDDHIKNFSFLLEKNAEWVLSPAYDLTFSRGMGGEHFLDLYGEAKSPGAEQLLRLGRDSHLEPDFVANAIERVAEVAGRFAMIARDYPVRKTTILEIEKTINENRARMKLRATVPSDAKNPKLK